MLTKITVLIRRILQVDIVKVFSLNAVSTLVRMLTGLISVKFVATIIGPTGIALLGQLNNFTTILLGISNGGINNGITKYVAQYKDDNNYIKLLLSNALKLTLFFTLITSLVLILFHSYLSKWIMLSEKYGFIFLIFGFTILLYTLNSLLISILNGFKEFKKYVVINISGTIIGLCFTIILVLLWDLNGALISAVTYQSVVFFITLFLCRKFYWLSKNYFSKQLNNEVIKQYLKYSIMTLVSLALVPVGQMLLRGYVISNISATEAGLWEAMNRISSMYLMVITSSFSIYYLPRLSEIDNQTELRLEIFRCYKIIVPLLVVGFTIIYLLRHFIIHLLFSPDFYQMDKLFIWQLSGDFFKITSWLLAFMMVAKSMTKTFICTEIVFSGLFVLLGFIFVNHIGIIGLTQAYLLNYILYLFCMVFLFRKLIFIIK